MKLRNKGKRDSMRERVRERSSSGERERERSPAGERERERSKSSRGDRLLKGERVMERHTVFKLTNDLEKAAGDRERGSVGNGAGESKRRRGERLKEQDGLEWGV